MNQYCVELGHDSGNLGSPNGGGSCFIYTGSSWSLSSDTYAQAVCEDVV